MLHLISASPIETAVWERIASGDSVVFLENALLRILRNGALSVRLSEMSADHRLYAIFDDLIIRGIDPDEIAQGIEMIDYIGLVGLAVAHPLILSWS